MNRLRVLVVAPNLSGRDVGEAYSVFKLVEALSAEVDMTVLTLQTHGQPPLGPSLPHARVVSWAEPSFLRHPRMERITAQMKPALPVFFRMVRRWIRQRQAEGKRWDIAHQIMPQAMRYACPLRGLGMPYVVGPLGGSLETPPGFGDEVRGGAMSRLRQLDRWRLRQDRSLRTGYAEADLILGVAPYIGDILRAAGIEPRRFEPVLERGHDGRFPEVGRRTEPGVAKLLHVGRVIRTKGLRDMVRAMALLDDLPGVTLTSVGDGEDLSACRAEAERLGVAERIAFLGRIPREEVDRHYAEADIFTFPSFREPMGGVFFEAMTYGLPVITAARGGPDFIVDDSCGIRLPVETPEQFAQAIADAVRRLALDPDLRLRLGCGARERMAAIGDWSDKARHMVGLYGEVIA